MKKSLILCAILLAASAHAAGWQDALNKETLNQGAQILGAANSGDYKSAVSRALNAAVKELSNGGFLNNATAKIPLPKSLETAANLAKKVGGEKWANELVTSINNAASAAVPGAADVFSGVIKNMSDVKKVLEGGKDSFTKFLQQNSSQKLQAVFKPIITKMMGDNTFATAYNGLNSFVAGSALAKSDTAKQLKGIATSMGAGEYIPQENEDLNDYITRKTLDGLFNVMSEKESSLRGGAVEQGTKILQGIFK
ncbi:DUF4197 domain-containing protein [Campylobacter showae]|uniref:DUF4197 domain-containing protein n=1 Tax=Campylobacter showae TaxID=204 RepID=UPI0026EF40A1|nr:DUF4197 domain-containing protein [Campylobacter showae]